MNGTTIFGVSKTSINGMLALLIAVGLALLASGSPLIGATATLWITLGLSVLRALVGFLQNDAVTPANQTSQVNIAGPVSKMLLIVLLVGGAAVGAMMISGCQHNTQPPAWALTAPERTVGDVIYSANAAVVKYEADVTAGVPAAANPQLKATMRDIQKALTVAQPAYDVWAAALKQNPAAPEPANLAGAIAAIQTLLGQLPSLTK